MAFDRAKPLSEFAWSARVKHSFIKEGLSTVGDVLDYGAMPFLRVPGFGRESLREVENVLGPLHVASRDSPDLTGVSNDALLQELKRRLSDV